MAQKKIEIIVDIENNDIQITSEKTLTLTQQIRLLKQELQKTREGTKEFEILKNKLNETTDQFTRVNAKSRELFGTLSLIPGPIGDIAGKLNGAISLFKTFSGFKLSDLTSQFKALGQDLAGILENLGSWAFTSQKVADSNQEVVQSNEDLSTTLDANAAGAADVGAQLQRNIASQKSLTQEVQDNIQFLQGQADIYNEVIGNQQKQIAVIEKQIEANGGLEKATEQELKQLTELRTELTKLQDNKKILISDIEKEEQKRKDLTGSINKETGAVETNTQAVKKGIDMKKLFMGALTAVGIGLAINLLADLTQKFIDFVTGAAKAKRELEEFTFQVKENSYWLDDNLKTIDRTNKIRIAEMRAAGSTEAEIRAEELRIAQENYNTLVKLADDAYKLETELFRQEKYEQFSIASEDFRRKRDLQNQAYTDLQLTIARNKEAENKEVNEKKERDKKAAEDRRKQAADTAKQELEELREIQRNADLTLMKDRDREIAIVNDKYAEQIALAKKYKQDTTDLEKARAKEIAEINKKYDAEERQRRAQEIDALIELEKNKGKDGLETDKQILSDLLNQRMEFELRELDGVENAEAQKLAIRQKYAKILEDEIKSDNDKKLENLFNQLDNELVALDGNYAQQVEKFKQIQQVISQTDFDEEGKRLEVRKNYSQEFLNVLDGESQNEQLKLQMKYQTQNQYSEEYFNALRQKYADDLQRLNEAKQNELITLEQYNQRLAELSDARRQTDILEAESKAKLANAIGAAVMGVADIVGKNTVAGKGLAVAATLINTYAAIAGQLAAFAGVPIPGFAIAQAIATGLVGFKQVAEILKVKVPNQQSQSTASPTSNQAARSAINVVAQGRRRGGFISRANGGLVSGPGSETSDSIAAFLSDGEYVINARSTRLFEPILSAINDYGLNQPAFASGGLVFNKNDRGDSMTSNMSTTDLISRTTEIPIRTYVSSTEITNNQQFDRIQKQRSLI